MKSKMFANIYEKYTQTIWNIGFVNNDLQNILSEETLSIQWMKHSYKDRWFADPFVLRTTDQDIILLVEEYYLPTKKGRISKLRVDKKTFILKSCDVVLELDTHLSFPAIFRNGKDIFFYPENAATGNLILYKYSENVNKVEPVSLLAKEPLTDTIITTVFGRPYIFSTKQPVQNKNMLEIYISNKWDGEYRIDHSFDFHDKTARNAGDLFQVNNKWIRPAQDCNGYYGKGLVLYEIIFQDNKFMFQEVKRFYPTSKRWNLGMHTFNIRENVIVTDGNGYYNPVLRNFLVKLKHIIRLVIPSKVE